jgi:hypothetical protein
MFVRLAPNLPALPRFGTLPRAFCCHTPPNPQNVTPATPSKSSSSRHQNHGDTLSPLECAFTKNTRMCTPPTIIPLNLYFKFLALLPFRHSFHRSVVRFAPPTFALRIRAALPKVSVRRLFNFSASSRNTGHGSRFTMHAPHSPLSLYLSFIIFVPVPSLSVWIASAGKGPNRSVNPLGHRTSTDSTLVAAPNPK